MSDHRNLVRRLGAAADGIEDVNFDLMSRRRGYRKLLREAATALESAGVECEHNS